MPMPMPPTMYPPTMGAGGQQYYYAPPPPPVAKKSSGSDVPAWMWVGLGVALATVGGKIFGAKKQDMQSMMMQQMMKQFTSQAGGGMPGGMPGMGMPGMPGMPGAGMPGAAGGFPPFPGASATPPVDVKPSPPKPATPKPATAATPTSSGRGSATTTQPTTAEEPSPAVKSEFAGFADQQTPVVEPTTVPPASNPFFDDAEDTPAAGAATDDVSEEDLQYMQDMIRNPEMQKLMYPYLPEFMRNPETFEMLLSNPQYKDQLKGIMLQMKAGGMGGSGRHEHARHQLPRSARAVRANGHEAGGRAHANHVRPRVGASVPRPQGAGRRHGLLHEPDEHHQVPKRSANHGRL